MPTAWNLSCPDWQDRIRAGRPPIPDLPLTPHGDRAVAVYDRLRLADVTGTPTLADASGDWFREIVRAMFGAWDPVTRTRYIRELFALVPKKNSKTTYGALGLMLTALLLNERPRAPFLFAGPVQDTAELAFDAVAGAIALDPVLEKKLHVRDHLKTIVHRDTKATLEIITFDPRIVTGMKVVGAFIDEEHVLGKMPRADKAMLQLRGGMQPFEEAFLAVITTQSDEQPAGIFKQDLDRARDVRDGVRDGQVLPVLYEFPEEMQRDPAMPWKDPKHWHFVTPNLGRSIQLERLVEEFRDEEAKGEAALRTWASQHLNVEIGVAMRANGWVGQRHWEAGGDESLTLEALIERSEVITVGIDGGGLEDLLGLTVIGREKATGEWLTWSHAWAYVGLVDDRHLQMASRLRDFERAGDLTILDNIGDDVEQVADRVEQLEKAGLLDRIGVDRAGIGAIVQSIVARGIAYERVVAIPQGSWLVGAIKTVERKLAAGALHHGASPMMAWCVGNSKTEIRGNATIVTKQAGSDKVDPVLALFNAAALMSMNPKARARKHQMFFV